MTVVDIMNPGYQRPAYKYENRHAKYLVCALMFKDHSYVSWRICEYNGNNFFIKMDDGYDDYNIIIKDDLIVGWSYLPDTIEHASKYMRQEIDIN